MSVRFGDTEPLGVTQTLDGFDCGVESLNVWLAEHARSAAASGSARVFVTVDREQGRVCGYYAVAAAAIAHEQATERTRKGQPRHPIPAVLLARLAVDASVQGQGPNIGSLNAHTFGTADDPYIVVNAALIDHLSEPELLDVIGHECGHIQNNHVVYMTTLHFLKHAANMFLRWSVKPAVLALNGWARRAEITCDRAGLICTRDLDVSIGCLVKLAIGSQKLYSEVNLPEYLAQLDEAQAGLGRFDELTRTHPYLPKRVAALRLFAETTYFRSLVGTGRAAGAPADALPAGTSKDECDARVAELIAVL